MAYICGVCLKLGLSRDKVAYCIEHDLYECLSCFSLMVHKLEWGDDDPREEDEWTDLSRWAIEDACEDEADDHSG